MIRPIDIRLNAAHPDLPLAEAVTYTGAPSTVLIRGVPGNCGRWAITAVFVAATFPDGSTTTRTAVQSANGVWVATLPATATSGRTAHGLRILADGADENGEAVGGYVLGVADFAVASLAVTPAPEPGETSWQMLYFDAVPGVLRKGDVTKIDGVLKLYNGTAWEAFAIVPAPSTANPQMDGTADPGTPASYACGDHVHPTDTSRVPTSRTINGKALTNDVMLDADDVGALPSTTDGSNRYVGADVHFTAGGGDIDLPLGGTGTLTYRSRSSIPTQANLAAWGADGKLVDSGEKPSDFQDALTAQQLANIAAVSDALTFDATHSYAAGDTVVYNGTLYTFTAAHTGAWTGSDVAAVNIIARLAGKLDKSGGTMTGPLLLHYLNSSDFGGDHFCFKRFDDTESLFDVMRRMDIAGLATRAANPTAGNLAALDASGNPTDAGWTADNLARYALSTKTIDNGAVTLDDRAVNAVAVSSALASLTINFPTATSGKVRDFGLRLSVASGITTAPELVLPQGITFENADGEVPEIGADGAATILYFTETASGVFLVKGEVVTAIS